MSTKVNSAYVLTNGEKTYKLLPIVLHEYCLFDVDFTKINSNCDVMYIPGNFKNILAYTDRLLSTGMSKTLCTR